MATVKFIGRDDSNCSWTNWDNYAVWDRFICSISGRCSELHIKLNGNCNIKVAIFSDSGGIPGIVLAKKDATTSCTAGWNSIAFEIPVDIISGTKYWLAVACSMTGSYAGYLSQTGDGHKYKSIIYGSWTWGDNPSALSTSNNYISMMAGWGILVLSPPGISQSISCGVPKLHIFIKSLGIVQPVAFGAPSVVTQKIFISPQSSTLSAFYGIPTLRFPQTILVSSTSHFPIIGVPRLGILGFIKSQCIIQPVTIGMPTLFKYVWHVILDGQYAIETERINRVLVIGRDQQGNPVYGAATNAEEVARVGERLDFQTDTAISTSSQAVDVASAILAKIRLNGKRGFIVIPPNCGQELFDVIEVTDNKCAQWAQEYRVTGIYFEFNCKQARYENRIILNSI